MNELDPDWIIVTLITGERKPIRRLGVSSYGTLQASRYVEYDGKFLAVTDAVADIARKVRGPIP